MLDIGMKRFMYRPIQDISIGLLCTVIVIFIFVFSKTDTQTNTFREKKLLICEIIRMVYNIILELKYSLNILNSIH